MRAGDHEAAIAIMREAVEHLTRAAALDPKAASWADGDTDLVSLRERPDFPF